jgi:hypothetical protein
VESETVVESILVASFATAVKTATGSAGLLSTTMIVVVTV